MLTSAQIRTPPVRESKRVPGAFRAVAASASGLMSASSSRVVAKGARFRCWPEDQVHVRGVELLPTFDEVHVEARLHPHPSKVEVKGLDHVS